MYRSLLIVSLARTGRFACFPSSTLFVIGEKIADFEHNERILSSMNEDSKSSFKSRLRQERFLRGWSQQALADQLGTTTVTVSRWERGTQFPGPMMRLKLCMLFEKTERELGLAPEESESVTPLAPQTSQGASIFTQGVESVADEAPEESTPAELRATPHSIQETSSIFLSPETKEPVPEHPLFASSSSLDHPRLRFPLFRSSAEWMRTLTCLLLFVLMISLFLGLLHSPQAQLKGNLGQPFPAATIEPVPAPYGVSGHLVFDDALRDRQTGPMWFLSDPHQPFGCHFLSGAYDIRDVESNYCLASKTDFANFVYQIEMTTLQEQSGQAGRILFRVDDAQDA